MSGTNRFLSLSNHSQLNLESTQNKVLDQLKSELSVNVLSLPPSGNAVDLVDLATNPIDVNTGNAGVGTQRVVLATDQPSVETNLEQIGGAPVVTGAGVWTPETLRVILASNGSAGAIDMTQIGGGNLTATNIGNADGGTQRVVLASDQPEVASNLEQINGVAVSVSSGNFDPGTQRVVLADDQPSVETNIGEIAFNPIDVNTGNASAGTQRVVLATDQPEVATNITELNNNTINTGAGIISTGTQRVVIASDQSRVLTKNFRPGARHLRANMFTTNINANYIISPNSDGLVLSRAKDHTSTGVAGAFTLGISSSSALDADPAGTGARQLSLQYYTDETTGSLTSTTVLLNGQTTVTVANFYRLHAAFITSTGATGSNQGTIYLYNNAAIVLLGVPATHIVSVIPINANRWNYGSEFIPKHDDYLYIILDYLNVVSSCDVNIISTFNIYARAVTSGTITPFQLLNGTTLVGAGNAGTKIDLSDVQLDSNFLAYDIIFVYNHTTAQDWGLSYSLGYHYSNEPY